MLLSRRLLPTLRPLLPRHPHRPLSYPFCKNFLKLTSTEFQQQLGLSTKLHHLLHQTQQQQKLSQKLFSVPFIAGISLLVLLLLNFNEQTKNNLLYSTKTALALFLASATSIKACQKWKLQAMYQHTTHVKSPNNPTFLYQLHNYLLTNPTPSPTQLPKITSILSFSLSTLATPPSPQHLTLLTQILELSHTIPSLLRSPPIKQLTTVLLEYGEMEEQYLGMMSNLGVEVSERAVGRLKENLRAVRNLKDVEVEGLKGRMRLAKRQGLFVVKGVMERGKGDEEVKKLVREIFEEE